MKKLMLWLSIVLAIGLTAQTAKAMFIPDELYLSYDKGDGQNWQMAQRFTKNADGDFSFNLGKVDSKVYFMVQRSATQDWNALRGDNAWQQYACSGSSKEGNNPVLTNGCELYYYATFKDVLVVNVSGDNVTFNVKFSDTRKDGADNNIANFTFSDGGTVVNPPVTVTNVNMPLKPADFANGKKHYFLVGSRQADWRLQPEWEFSKPGDNAGELKIDGARVMYTGLVEIGVCKSYEDYINQRYERWNAQNGATINLSNRSVENLTWRENFSFYENALPGNYADKFCASEDTEYNYAAVRDSKGALVSSVVLKIDGNGNPERWYITIPDGNPAKACAAVPENITFSLVGDAINNEALVAAGEFHTQVDVMTGWQDAWVQYDAEGNPYRDAKGRLLYQTVFQPEWLKAHPSYFNKTIAGTGSATHNFEYTSRNLVMQNASTMSAQELAEDPYAPIYLRFKNANDKTIGDRTVKVGDFDYKEKLRFYHDKGTDENPYSEGTRPVTAGVDWQCFVVKDMWVQGAFKVWTGWGGGLKKNEATNPGTDDAERCRWNFVNGGHAQKMKNRPVFGSDIIGANGDDALLYATYRDVDGANFQVDDLTYFKRVIVWYDPSSEDFNNSVIQLIVENLGPNIKATRDPQVGSQINLDWNLSNVTTDEEKALGVTSYEIVRYIIDENGSRRLSGSLGVIPTPGKTVGDFLTSQLLSDPNLSASTYQYMIIVKFADGTERDAWSNEVTLYDASAPVQAVAYQRVVEAGENDLDGTEATEKLYSFDAVLDLNISSTALSQSYDGVYTRDLIDGYLIKIGGTEMTDLNVTKLYVNGKEYAKTFYTDNSKTVYVGGTTTTLSGYWMEVPFADFGGEVKLSLRWENCAKQEPGPAYSYEVYLIPNADKTSQFAAAQFGSTTTRFEMHIPGITFNWDNSGIAQRAFDGTHDDNCLSAMPMGTHLDATNLYAPIHYSQVNYLYANGKLGTAPVTESVRRGFDIVVKAGTAADNLADAAEGAAYNVKDIAIDGFASEDESFPCERKLMKLQGAPAVLVHAWSYIDYVRKELVASETGKRHMGDAKPIQGGIATIVLNPLEAPDFSTGKPQVTGTFMDTDAKVRYSVHNLYLPMTITSGISAQANGTQLFRTVGFYVAPETQTVPAAFIPANDKSARGGIVAHESNKGEFELNDGLAGYTPFEAASGFSQNNNWSEIAYEQEHLPVIVNYYAAKQGNTEMTGSELPTAKATLTYHYPFMSGDHVLTLTEGTTKSVSLSDAAISTGIEGVSADLDGEVTYYNMQGIRVENPVEGQVYLEVSAAGVRKVMK